jgi:hypothetical protein
MGPHDHDSPETAIQRDDDHNESNHPEAPPVMRFNTLQNPIDAAALAELAVYGVQKLTVVDASLLSLISARKLMADIIEVDNDRE